MPAKLFCIGLDSADPTLVRHWAELGLLPTLAGLLEQGQHGEVLSPPTFADHASWMSFTLGKSPAIHGRYYGRQLDPNTYRTVVYDPTLPAAEPFWAAWKPGRGRVAVIDVPDCPRPEGTHGVQLNSWMVHTGQPGLMQSEPRDFAERVRRGFGEPVSRCWGMGRTPADARELARRLTAQIERKTELVRHCLQEEWDMLLTVFGESHCAGHECWRPEYTTASDQRPQDEEPVLQVYRALDRALEVILEHAGPEVQLVVFSNSGITLPESGNSILDDLLRRIDESRTPALQMARALRGLWRLLPIETQKRRKPYRLSAPMLATERSRRRCFAVDNNLSHGAIRLNLAGRDPQGCLSPGAEALALTARIEEVLLELREKGTGAPVVEEVLHRDAVYGADSHPGLPDLYVRWRNRSPIRHLVSPVAGEFAVHPPPVLGNNDTRGFWIASGSKMDPDTWCGALPIEELGPRLLSTLASLA